LSTSEQILRALILSKRKGGHIDLGNLSSEKALLEQLKKLNLGKDSIYELNPADIINEEDYEESSMGDQLSALKKRKKDVSLLGYSLRKNQTGIES